MEEKDFFFSFHLTCVPTVSGRTSETSIPTHISVFRYVLQLRTPQILSQIRGWETSEKCQQIVLFDFSAPLTNKKISRTH